MCRESRRFVKAPRDREHDKWIPWYVEDTPGWLELTLAARGAMEGIARKLNDKTGRLTLRRGLPSLALLLHVTWAELEPALGELIRCGKLEWDGSTFQLFDPDYGERRRHGSADRMANKRARDRGVTDVTSLPSPASLPSLVTPVTAVLVSSDLISDPDMDLTREAPSGIRAAVATDPGDLTPEHRTIAAQVCEPTGARLDVDHEWRTYVARCGMTGSYVTSSGWRYWLCNAVKYAAKDRARERQRDDDAAERKRFAREGPAPPPKLTKAQSEAFAEQLAARMGLKARAGT